MRDYYDEQNDPIPSWLHYVAAVLVVTAWAACMVLGLWLVCGG